MARKIIPDGIRDKVHYDPELGILTWKHKHPNQRNGGPITNLDTWGSISFSYRVDGKIQFFLGHRVAWFLMTGEQPDVIDHINGNRQDNRFCNLRNGTAKDNQRNRAKHRGGQPPGISWNKEKRKWRATVSSLDTAGRGAVFVGYFTNKEKAFQALRKKIRELKT